MYGTQKGTGSIEGEGLKHAQSAPPTASMRNQPAAQHCAPHTYHWTAAWLTATVISLLLRCRQQCPGAAGPLPGRQGMLEGELKQHRSGWLGGHP